MMGTTHTHHGITHSQYEATNASINNAFEEFSVKHLLSDKCLALFDVLLKLGQASLQKLLLLW